MTAIASAFLIVERRWATTNVVRPLHNSSSACWIMISVVLSNADVASSKISIGGFFKDTAKLIVPKKKEESPAATAVKGKKLTKPPQILTRDPRDLAALEAMPGYVKGGPVTDELSPYKIAGAAWRSPTTYYYMNGRIVTGDKVNEKLIEKGAYIFYKGDPPEKR